MALFDWRKFIFFDLQFIADEGKVAKTLQDSITTCGSSGRAQNIICDSRGWIHIFYRNWSNVSYKGHENAILFCELSTQNNLLVTISCHDAGEGPTVKVWNLSKISKSNGASCISIIRGAFQAPTALGVAENGQYMAIGYLHGIISLYRGDIALDKSKTLRTLSGGNTAIKGIKFKQQGKQSNMFICTEYETIVYNLYGRDKEIKTVLDNSVSPTRCCALQSNIGIHDSNFMVGRDDAIYCYTADGRGPCYALEGKKVMIEWFRAHLIIITSTNKKTSPIQKEHTLTIIDIQNKFIVYTSAIDSIAAIFIEFGTCLILTKKKQIIQLNEKDLQKKLNLLFKKNLYDIAIRIAKNQQYDSEGLAVICKQYADHLYNKGHFSAAVEQYIKTIQYLEPSYIIRKFLDSRHIHFLTDYLQALHLKSEATVHHTTLLMNCLTRLELTAKLIEFLSSDRLPTVLFNVEVALKLCRASSVNAVLDLAKRNKKHDVILNILIEDINNYEEALEYTTTLNEKDVDLILKNYGSLLMNYFPERTTNIVKQFYANFKNTYNPGTSIQLFLKHPERLIDFLEYIVTNIKNCGRNIYNTLIELYLQKWTNGNGGANRFIEILKTYEQFFDKNHIFIQVKLYNCMPGIFWMYEEEKLYHLILHHQIRSKSYSGILDCCKNLGSLQPGLWLQALNGLRIQYDAPQNLLKEVLNVIASNSLQSPLQTLNGLAMLEGPMLSNVREYFVQIFQKELDYTLQEENNVRTLQKQLFLLNTHIKNLRTQAIEFRSAMCDTCHQPLNMPAVYFFCQHSFHQECIRTYSDNEKECGVCNTKNSQLILALVAQNESRNQHEIFHNTLDRSNDPFSVVSQYFARGLFNRILIVDEHEMHEINISIIEGNRYQQINSTDCESKLSFAQPTLTYDTLKKTKYGTHAEVSTKKFSKNRIEHFINSELSKETDVISNHVSSHENLNPFENVVEYDESKNPFAGYSEYDNNLNPFT